MYCCNSNKLILTESTAAISQKTHYQTLN